VTKWSCVGQCCRISVLWATREFVTLNLPYFSALSNVIIVIQCGKRSFIEYAINGTFEPSITGTLRAPYQKTAFPPYLFFPENPTGFGRAVRSSFQVPVVLENGSKESISIEPRDDATDLSIALARLNPFKRSYIVCFDITTRSSWEYITRQASALGPHYAGVRIFFYFLLRNYIRK
jgi:hypothetical protein